METIILKYAGVPGDSIDFNSLHWAHKGQRDQTDPFGHISMKNGENENQDSWGQFRLHRVPIAHLRPVRAELVLRNPNLHEHFHFHRFS